MPKNKITDYRISIFRSLFSSQHRRRKTGRPGTNQNRESDGDIFSTISDIFGRNFEPLTSAFSSLLDDDDSSSTLHDNEGLTNLL
jgi:hypothetical protein